MDWRDLLPGIIGSFVGVTGWLLVGLYIQRRQFMRQARNAAKAVYFELDVNRMTISVGRDHGMFADLDRSSFERLLPELATLLPAGDLRAVVDAYMTHAGYRQLAAQDEMPADVRRHALGRYLEVHERSLATLQRAAFSRAEMKAISAPVPAAAAGDIQSVISAMTDAVSRQDWDRLNDAFLADGVLEYPQSREVFRGLDNIRAQFENYPGLDPGGSQLAEVISDEAYALTPSYTVIRVEGSGTRGTAVIRVRYPDGSLWWVLNIFQVRDGRISRSRAYFAQDFPAPDWRAPYRESP